MKAKEHPDPSSLTPGKIAWRRFRQNRFSLAGGIFLILLFLTSLLGYLITPDSTPNANSQHLALTTQKPGFEVDMIKVRRNVPQERKSWLRTMLTGKHNRFETVPFNDYRFTGQQLIVKEYTRYEEEEEFIREIHPVDVVFALDTEKPVTWQNGSFHFTNIHGQKKSIAYDRLKQTITDKHVIHQRFLLGTDRFGRDLLSRLIIGARISLAVGFISVFISLVIGLTLGSIAGYFRGKADDLIMWLINVVWSIPTLLMVIAITLVIGKGFWQIFIAVGLTMWVEVARVVRGQIISVREKEFVEAARAMGLPSLRIITRHILPNVINPVIIISAANFASAILIEAGLSFLGIGVQPPMPSWGTMIKQHYGYILVDMGYLAILPGAAIMLTVLSFTLIGNGLRDALDTRANIRIT
jgi:peptide/nickel transport system permease protein